MTYLLYLFGFVSVLVAPLKILFTRPLNVCQVYLFYQSDLLTLFVLALNLTLCTSIIFGLQAKSGEIETLFRILGILVLKNHNCQKLVIGILLKLM